MKFDKGTIRRGVDDARRSSIKAHSVGVDDHIDPRIFAKSFKLMTLLKKATTKFCTEINIVCRIISFFIARGERLPVYEKKIDSS